MTAYYNENDPKAAAWLRELIARGLIAPGDVDERSIVEVTPNDVKGYTQCHFFAGIGGWSYALRLAGAADDAEVWTGSCPCQPFSVAGKGKAEKDERHLWPEFRRLIAECRPAIAFGEQVASRAGREWLAGVRTDLEALGYAVGAADLCAASVGAPHIRQRLYWVADAAGTQQHVTGRWYARQRREKVGLSCDGATGGVADADSQRFVRQHALLREETSRRGERCILETAGSGAISGMGDAKSKQARVSGQPWRQSDAIPCIDGKARRIESGTFPLAHGVPARVGRLRGYGNAIVPQVAAEFVKAFYGLA